MKQGLIKAVHLFTVLALLMALAPNTVYADAEGDWEYRVQGKNVVITKYIGTDANPVTPATLGGKTVTGIAVDTFNGRPILMLTLSSGIRDIEPGAFFECRTLMEFKVNAENKVFTAQNGALFRDGGKILTQYPAGKTNPSYVIPDGVTEIAASAFDHNTFLESIIIPESVTKIGQGAFWRTSALKSIRIPAAVSSIGGSAFANCGTLKSIDVDEGNQKYKSVDGVLFTKDGTHLVQCPPGFVGHFNVPDCVKALDEGSFRGDYSMTGITIGDNVTFIDDCAFCYCEVLDTVQLGKNITTIGFQAFQGCNILKTVIFPAGLKQIGDGAFKDCPLLDAVYFQGAPPKAFGQGAFDNCAGNFTIYYPESTEKSWKGFKQYTAKPYTKLPSLPTTPPLPSPSTEPTSTPEPTVKAVCKPVPTAGETPQRSTVTGKPILLSTRAFGSSGIRLAWTRVSGAAGYEIYRSIAYFGPFELVRFSRGSSCIIPTPADEKRYCYKVRVVYRNGALKSGGYSNMLFCNSRRLNTDWLSR